MRSFLSLLLLLAAGTSLAQTPVLLKDLNPGSPGSNPASPAVFGNKLFFYAQDGTTHGRELWYYDGVNMQMLPDRTYPLSNNTSTAGTVSDNRLMAVLNGQLYYQASDSEKFFELY